MQFSSVYKRQILDRISRISEFLPMSFTPVGHAPFKGCVQSVSLDESENIVPHLISKAKNVARRNSSHFRSKILDAQREIYQPFTFHHVILGHTTTKFRSNTYLNETTLHMVSKAPGSRLHIFMTLPPKDFHLTTIWFTFLETLSFPRVTRSTPGRPFLLGHVCTFRLQS